MKWSTRFLAAAVILLLLVDVLTFHDLFEPHTARDWLTLLASILAAVGLAGRLAVPAQLSRLHG